MSLQCLLESHAAQPGGQTMNYLSNMTDKTVASVIINNRKGHFLVTEVNYACGFHI